MTEDPVRPVRVSLVAQPDGKASAYEDLFRCPIEFDADAEIWVYDAAELEEKLPGSMSSPYCR